jgi:predicted RNA-binding Zn ribbon-like protein
MSHIDLFDRISWPDAFVGGALCLDFCNTVESPGTEEFVERLSSYTALLEWCVATGCMIAATAQKLSALAKRQTSEAARVAADAIRMREELYCVFSALETRNTATVPVTSLNSWLDSLPALPSLQANRNGNYLFTLAGRSLLEPLWPILWSSVAMLTSDNIYRLGRCHASPCRYLFVDTSRNGTRQWCSSATCGNRQRVRRAYRAARFRSGAKVRHR